MIKMDECVICSAPVDEKEAPLLEMGGFGNPKYLCSECSSELDTATLGTNLDEITEAMQRLSKKMSNSDASRSTFATVKEILDRAAERAKAIKEGTYDFSLDEIEEGEVFEEIPDELRETEEDLELDKRDEEKAERFNQIFDYFAFGAFVGIAIFAIWKIVDTFIL